jgi:Synaptobrevin
MSNTEASKITQIQQEVDCVVDIMRKNMIAIVDRDEKLNDLEGKSQLLLEDSKKFKRFATKLNRKMWWANMKYKIIAAIVILVFIVIVGLIIYYK